VVALLLMRHEVLQPGQAVFMPAGGLHAYLHGTGIELLANSDNVVRSGLTGKHIDVPELLRLLDPAVAVPVLSPRSLADGLATFDTPAPEFRLYLLDVAASPALPGTGPAILLCLDGTCTLRAASGQELDLARGDSCFIPFADGPPPRHRRSPPSPSHPRHAAHPPLTPPHPTPNATPPARSAASPRP
jgi:mannose-6-phosphate isomerase